MKRVLFFCGVVAILASCGSSKNQQKNNSTAKEPIILSVGDVSVTKSEFDYVYAKNNSKSENAYTEASLKEYLDLYIRFKLKVTEAEKQKLDTSAAFIKELNGYKRQLAKPYLTEKSFNENMAKEAYERLKKEVNASHILVKVDENALPKDTLKAYLKIDSILTVINKGADFGEMAIKFSDDPSSKMEEAPLGYKGNLGYFTAFNMVYEFEDAAFKTPVGKVSKPFRTRFGYHILKVHDLRDSKGEVKVAHIMLNAAEGISKEDDELAYKRILEIREKATNGADWDKLCNDYSEHLATKQTGGVMKPFSSGGRLGAPTFEEASFKLQNIGDISEPVKTVYGWHIIKLIEKISLAPYKDMEKELLQKVAKDSRAQLNRKALINRLKKENNFKENALGLEKAKSKIDSTLTKGTWKYDTEDPIAKLTLFTINNDKYTVGGLFDYFVRTQSPKKGGDPMYVFNQYYQQYIDQMNYEYEESHLEEKYTDYRMLVKEYKDGILLFKLMEDNVWNKAVEDTTGLRTYYESNKDKYKWSERLKTKVYTFEDISKKDELMNDVKKGLPDNEMYAKYNLGSSFKLHIEEGTYEIKEREYLADLKASQPGVYHTSRDGKNYIVNVLGIVPGSTKKLNETKGAVISAYQTELEENWIKELRNKYPVKIYENEFNSLIRK